MQPFRLPFQRRKRPHHFFVLVARPTQDHDYGQLLILENRARGRNMLILALFLEVEKERERRALLM
jgi:hypothetical protein